MSKPKKVDYDATTPDGRAKIDEAVVALLTHEAEPPRAILRQLPGMRAGVLSRSLKRLAEKGRAVREGQHGQTTYRQA